MSALPVARLVHALPGRARVHVAERRGDGDYFNDARERLGRCGDVRWVEVNPRTGSVLVGFDGSIDGLRAFAEKEGVFALDGLAKTGAKPVETVAAGMGWAASLTPDLSGFEAGVKRLFGEKTDLWTVLSTVFVALAVIQLFRGRVLGPATTLLWAATSAMRFAARAKENRVTKA